MSVIENHPAQTVAANLSVGRLSEDDLDAADRIMRNAFGTYLGAPDPTAVFGDAEYVRPRFRAQPDWAFGAYLDSSLVGSNFATRWGSFGFFGPLSVDPAVWDQGIASRLMEPIVELFDQWGLRQTALFTFPQSPRHIGLYQKFGFWPQHLTPLMEKAVEFPDSPQPVRTYSALRAEEKSEIRAACRSLTDAIFEGLDLSHEIQVTDTQQLGDTVLLDDGTSLDGFAVCHCGAGEAGSGVCFVKFGAVRGGPKARDRFERLLKACEQLAVARNIARIVAGVNSARHEAYRTLLALGYRTWLEGVIMQRPNEYGYCRPDAYVVDDLR